MCPAELGQPYGYPGRSRVQYRAAEKLGLRLEYEDYGKMSGDDVWGTGGSGAIKGSAWYLAAQLMF